MLFLSIRALSARAHLDGMFVETYYRDVNFRDGINRDQLVHELIRPNIVGYVFNFYADNEFMKEIVQILKDNGIVVCCRSFTPLDYCSSVVGQMEEGVRTAVEDMLLQGCRNIAYFGEMGMNSGYERVRRNGFERAFADFGMTPDQALYCDTFISSASGYQNAEKLIRSGKKFDAVFAGTDTIAYGILQAFSEHHIRTPEDVLIVASDDLPDSQMKYPQLSSISYPLNDFGKVMGDMLINEIRTSDHTVKTQHLPCIYIKRKIYFKINLYRKESCMSRIKNQSPFTLIELLVVIAIISILAAMLLPALNLARDRAKTLSCTAIAKQLCLGFVYYSDDFHSCLPMSWDNNSVRWQNRIYPYINQSITATSSENVLDRAGLVCPLEKGKPGSYTSFAMLSHAAGSKDSKWYFSMVKLKTHLKSQLWASKVPTLPEGIIRFQIMTW